MPNAVYISNHNTNPTSKVNKPGLFYQQFTPELPQCWSSLSSGLSHKQWKDSVSESVPYQHGRYRLQSSLHRTQGLSVTHTKVS